MEFTETEKTVILGLMRNPEHSDKEISGSMDMNVYTFNKIKNSLIKGGDIRKFYVPNFRKIGFGILSITHGSGLGDFIDREKLEKIGRDGSKEIPDQMIFGIFEGDTGIAFHLFKDYGDMKEAFRIKETIMDRLGIDDGALDHVLIPTGDLRVERFFDIESLIEDSISDRTVPRLDPRSTAQEAASSRWSDFFSESGRNDCSDLDDDELTVLYNIVRYSDLGDGDLMHRMDLSRYRFQKMKDDLLRNGFIKPFYAANVMKFGIRVMIFTHMRMKADQDPKELFKKYEDRMPSNLMIVAFDRSDIIGLGVFKDLPSGSNSQMRMRRAILEKGFLRKEPVIRIFSLPNIEEGNILSFHRPLNRIMKERGLNIDQEPGS